MGSQVTESPLPLRRSVQSLAPPRGSPRESPRPAGTLNEKTFLPHTKEKLIGKTASGYLVEVLEKTSVKRVYGVVGESLNGLTDALQRRKSIDWIHMRQEGAAAFAAAFAAGAEAHLTGSLAVCAGSCGPGNLHAINGLPAQRCVLAGRPSLSTLRRFISPADGGEGRGANT